MIERLEALLSKPERTFVGLMSGTSMDGIDAALVRIEGSGLATKARLEAFLCLPYESELHERLLRAASGGSLSALEFASLDFQVAASFAKAALQLVERSGRTPAEVDCIASHGQTLAHHAPGFEIWEPGAATWQAGNLSVIAALSGMPVVGDFRAADVALGGTGAPLVPYVDFLLRRSQEEGRLLLNIGGIANFTYLPAEGTLHDVLAWDVGPGNMVLDGLASRLLGVPWDTDGQVAARGTPDHDWVERLLQEEFFQRPAPKAAGREEFGSAYVQGLLDEGQVRGAAPEDLLATMLELTARAVAHACLTPPLAKRPLDAVYATGGGRRNQTLMRRLEELLHPTPVRGLEVLGCDVDAKEAIDFAVLGNETLSGHASNLTQVTGAQRPCVLGSLALAGFTPCALRWDNA